MTGTGRGPTGLGAQRDAVLRGVALVGIVAPIVFWLIVIVLGFITPGYSVVRDFISTLGEARMQYALVQRINFLILGAGLLAFAVGQHRFSRPGHWRPSAGGFLLGLSGVGIVGSGIFSANSIDPSSTTNMLHDLFGIVGFLAGIIGIFLLSRQFDRNEDWPRHRFATAGTMVAVIGSFVIFIGTSETAWVGVTQRVFLAIFTGWIVFQSFRLYQLAGDMRPTHPTAQPK